jgi:hypothetical protein
MGGDEDFLASDDVLSQCLPLAGSGLDGMHLDWLIKIQTHYMRIAGLLCVNCTSSADMHINLLLIDINGGK